MSDIVIQVEGLSKRYRLGTIGRTALHEDLSRWWARLRRRPDPTLRLDQVDRAGGGPRDDAEHVWALRNVSFEVRRGEVLGIIGRNGAGKSTVLKILSRVTAPTLGCVRIRGRIASLLEVGTGFHPELTGRENIFQNGAILGMSRAEVRRKFDEIVAFSGCERHIDTPVKRYSSGMYVRLAFAIAAHLEPETLIIDEVLAVGDAEFQRKCLGKMRDVATQGRTVIFVSHNMDAVTSLCTRGIVLADGALAFEGRTAREAVEAYMALALAGGGTGAAWTPPPGAAPAGRAVEPLRLAVTDDGGRVLTGPARCDEPLRVELEFQVNEVDPALMVGVWVKDLAGQPLWVSYQSDGREAEWPALRAGRNRLTCRLPPGLLNEGRYRVEFAASHYMRRWVVSPDGTAPSVQFELAGGLSASPYWTTRRPGLLAPRLPWTGEGG